MGKSIVADHGQIRSKSGQGRLADEPAKNRSRPLPAAVLLPISNGSYFFNGSWL